jgi:transposase
MASGKSGSDTFILELPLRVSPGQEKILLVRLDCARQLYNACLAEAMRRLKLIRQSKAHAAARATPKGKAKSRAFAQVNARFGFREYDLHAFAVRTKNACHIKDHLDVHVCQKIATRAFKAAQEHAFGRHGRPRFKSFNQLDSVEGKNNAAGIRWRNNRILWLGQDLEAILDPKDKHGVIRHGLEQRTKFNRIVRRKVRGKNRFYVQLIQEGLPKAKHQPGHGTVGLDLGPSSIAAVGDRAALLQALCPELEPIQGEVRLLQRRLDRSRRATNPDCFNPNGTIKKGCRLTYSQRFRQDREQLSDLNRRLAAQRKALHGQLINQLLAMGRTFNMEKLSYKAWQKTFGKSVGFRAPGMFVMMLRRKAESAGGLVNEFPASLGLSQTCHACATIEKKNLSQRWHHCDCGVHAQRDLYSAFLAKHVEGNGLDMRQAQLAWPGAEPLLRRAVSRCNQTAIGKARLATFGLDRRQSGSRDKEGSMPAEAQDVVACLIASESLGKARSTAFRTPGL